MTNPELKKQARNEVPSRPLLLPGPQDHTLTPMFPKCLPSPSHLVASRVRRRRAERVSQGLSEKPCLLSFGHMAVTLRATCVRWLSLWSWLLLSSLLLVRVRHVAASGEAGIPSERKGRVSQQAGAGWPHTHSCLVMVTSLESHTQSCPIMVRSLEPHCSPKDKHVLEVERSWLTVWPSRLTVCENPSYRWDSTLLRLNPSLLNLSKASLDKAKKYKKNDLVGLVTALYSCMGATAQGSQKMGWNPSTGVTNGCKLPDLGTGNWPWILWKSSKCS